MSQAYRIAGGAVKYVSGGIAGECLSRSHREYNLGFLDCQAGLAMYSCPSSGYKQGYKAYQLQDMRYQQARLMNQVRKDLGLTHYEFREVLGQEVRQAGTYLAR